VQGSHPVNRAISFHNFSRLCFAHADIFLFVISLLVKILYFSRYIGFTYAWSEMMAVSLGSILVCISLMMFVRHRIRRVVLLSIVLSSTILLFSDLIYWKIFGDVITIMDAREIAYLPAVWSSVTSVWSRYEWCLFLDLPLWLCLFTAEYFKKTPSEIPSLITKTALIISFLWLSGSLWLLLERNENIFQYRASNINIIQKIGILNFYLYDAYNYTENIFRTKSISQAELLDIYERFDQHNAQHNANVPYGVAQGQNLIFIQVESLSAFIIGLSIKDQEITPNLNRLSRTSVHFQNNFDQTAHGRTSDAEFCSLNSLLPISKGSVVYRHAVNDYEALPKILHDYGYYTLSSSFVSSFWNMRHMHRQYGFENSFFEQSFQKDEMIMNVLSDGSFFEQTLVRLKTIPQPFFAYLVTMTGHPPYQLPDQLKSMDLNLVQDKLLLDYMHAMHYLDQVLGKFLIRLKGADLLDKSVLVIYGDHNTGRLDRLLSPEGNTGIKHSDCMLPERLPLMIRLPNGQYARKDVRAAGHVDIAPSILHLLGIPRKGTFFLGNNLFNETTDAVVSFRNGSMINGKHHFITIDGTFKNGQCCAMASSDLMDPDLCLQSYRAAQKQLWISDMVIENNLIPRLKQMVKK